MHEGDLKGVWITNLVEVEHHHNKLKRYASEVEKIFLSLKSIHMAGFDAITNRSRLSTDSYVDPVLGCQLLSNYSVITIITVFWTSNVGYCLFFRRVIMKIGERNQKVRRK